MANNYWGNDMCVTVGAIASVASAAASAASAGYSIYSGQEAKQAAKKKAKVDAQQHQDLLDQQRSAQRTTATRNRYRWEEMAKRRYALTRGGTKSANSNLLGS